MKAEGKTNGIAEILESGQFPNTHNFRNPQSWSVWRDGKAAGREAAKSKHRGDRAFSILTQHGKDEKPPCLVGH